MEGIELALYYRISSSRLPWGIVQTYNWIRRSKLIKITPFMPHTWYRYWPTSVKFVTPAEDFIWDAKYAPLDQWSGPKWFGATTKYAWILAQRAQKQPWTGFTWTNEAIHRLDSHLFADSTLIGNHLHDTQVVSACCLLSTANRRTLFYNSFASAMQTIRQSWLSSSHGLRIISNILSSDPPTLSSVLLSLTARRWLLAHSRVMLRKSTFFNAIFAPTIPFWYRHENRLATKVRFACERKSRTTYCILRHHSTFLLGFSQLFSMTSHWPCQQRSACFFHIGRDANLASTRLNTYGRRRFPLVCSCSE